MLANEQTQTLTSRHWMTLTGERAVSITLIHVTPRTVQICKSIFANCTQTKQNNNANKVAANETMSTLYNHNIPSPSINLWRKLTIQFYAHFVFSTLAFGYRTQFTDPLFDNKTEVRAKITRCFFFVKGTNVIDRGENEKAQ